MLDPIHGALARQCLLPAEHLVDAGYVTPATMLRASTTYGVTVLGPVRPGSPRLRRPSFDKQDFQIDWDQHTATCPRGITSPPWNDAEIDGQPGQSVLFPRAACRACEHRLSCTGHTGGRGRHLLLMPRPLQEIQNRARAEQETPAWRARYALRAGCEATVSVTVHAHGLRHCRYRGLAKVHVQHVLTAAGTNINRLSEWFPPGTAPTRPSRPLTPFQRLCQNTTLPPGSWPSEDHQQHPEILAEPPFRVHRQPATLAVLAAVREFRAEGVEACATMDAGPNVHILTTPADHAAVRVRIATVPGVRRVIQDEVSGGPTSQTAISKPQKRSIEDP